MRFGCVGGESKVFQLSEQGWKPFVCLNEVELLLQALLGWLVGFWVYNSNQGGTNVSYKHDVSKQKEGKREEKNELARVDAFPTRLF